MSDAEVRFRQTLQMHEDGKAMFRLRVRRDHPLWSDEQVEDAVLAWLLDTPLEPGRLPSSQRVTRLTHGPTGPVS